ncbi:IS110 family transposase [candidate division TA06 bacterium]|uniref:IS110 family transposase n=1 Tax=candidate division TA06 bacterium TaxID=2250710 RepID=A0A660SHI3_UNCT6|nr:MAG: IS110 family transposase [candidate division TA06 bacterium]
MSSKKNKPTIFVGVDFHKKRFVCSFFDNTTGEIIQKSYDTTGLSYDEFTKAVLEYRRLGKQVKVALEMLTGSYYFYDKMIDSCDEIVIINSNKFKVIAESCKKTDKIDSSTIAVYYSKDLLPTVYIPENSIRQLRDLVSLRYRFVKERSGYKNRIHSLLLKNGITISKRSLGSKKRLIELQGLGLSKFYQKELNILIDQVNRLTEEVLEIERMMDELIEEESGDRVKEDIELLKSIPGVGDLSAKILVSCIADIERFSEEKQLASYVGLVPRVRDSGGVIHHGRITRKGNKIARTTLVQDALAMLKQKNGPLKGFYKGIKYRSGTGKAIIALARKLSTIMFVILKTKREFDYLKYRSKLCGT